jgi:opacity protein-like surface antigen
MSKFIVGAAIAAAFLPAAAMAQETAPDGTPAFGIEPYVAIMGGYHDFDSDNQGKLTSNCNGSSGCPDGGIIEGLAGVNVPLGKVFVGVEGNVAKGFKGLDWEYGAHVRSGFRAGDSGLIYTKIGYTWVDTKDKGKADNWSYGGGVEVGPADIGLGGLTGPAGPRLRFEVTTFDFHSIRPTAGLVFAF